ncbi:MAG: hypothetical protein ACN4GR_10905 [Arenicellales bacterium]
MSEKLPISVNELRAMIGMRVCYLGNHGIIIEVLEDGPSLVLQNTSTAAIQSNLHGHPTRRSPQTLTVQVLSENGTALHKEFLDLDLD